MLNRRTFLQASSAAAGGMLMSLYIDVPTCAQAPVPPTYPPEAFVHLSTFSTAFSPMWASRRVATAAECRLAKRSRGERRNDLSVGLNRGQTPGPAECFVTDADEYLTTRAK